MNSLIIHDFKEMSMVDGEGVRFAIFFQGCNHNCPGCHSPHTHDINKGYEYDMDDIILKIKDVIEWHDGITLSGGDPMFQPIKLKEFLIRIRKDEELKDINIWMYTGYTLDKIPKGITQYLDVIVDGPYIESLSPSKFAGSSNQIIWSRYKGTNKFIKRIYNERRKK